MRFIVALRISLINRSTMVGPYAFITVVIVGYFFFKARYLISKFEISFGGNFNRDSKSAL